MRRKTEEKKQEIIQAARQIFKEYGFERASMSKICSRFGGSKATLYNYFSSKEELFFEIMSISLTKEFEFVHNIIENTNKINNVHDELRDFGQRFLCFLYSPKLKELRRLAISQSGITDLGKIAYTNRTMKSQGIVAAYLNKAMEQNKLKKMDSLIATKHLYGLLESELIHQFLYQIDTKFTTKDIKEMANRAVDVFIAAYKKE